MPALPDAIQRALAAHLTPPFSVIPVAGGSIARAAKLGCAEGSYFLKWAAGDAGQTFEAEALGLHHLRAHAPPDLLVPEVIASGMRTRDTEGFLCTTWIEPGAFDRAAWVRFGEALAALHRAVPAPPPATGRYGFPSDNWIGRLPQPNPWHDDWPEFFAEARLGPQFERARSTGRWQTAWDASAERVLGRLPDLLPRRPHPSPLHGDLWAGNRIPTADGRVALIDPAAYVGHRETDLAMTELFGGFDPPFYEAYRASWPLEPAYPERRDVYQLYHLVNHLNHFGAGYASAVGRLLRRLA